MDLKTPSKSHGLRRRFDLALINQLMGCPGARSQYPVCLMCYLALEAPSAVAVAVLRSRIEWLLCVEFSI
jgi:hypothetical protein